ncbi:MAG: NAD-dependent epimerase/dehydratase family protein [Marinifilaceae bacterium]
MVFVTGATGMLGSHLIYHLAQMGEDVVALKRLGSNVKECKRVFMLYDGGSYLWPRIKWVEGDVLDVNTIEHNVERAHAVYHCAAVVSFNGSDKNVLRETNLTGTRNIAELCNKYGTPLIYVSSIAALGDVEDENEMITEDTAAIDGRKHSLYSESKRQSEEIVWEYVPKGLKTIIVNPSIILGAGMWDRSSSLLFKQARKGLPFYTLGVTGYVDVRDVCKLMIRLAQKEAYGQRFILNGGNYTYEFIFKLFAHALHIKAPWLYTPRFITLAVAGASCFISRFTGNKPQLTPETARTAHKKSCYSSDKVKRLLPSYRFYNVQETIKWIVTQWEES